MGKWQPVWQPIETVPLREDVICLWATCTVGHTIFYTDHDKKFTYAKYWMPFPKLPDCDETKETK